MRSDHNKPAPRELHRLEDPYDCIELDLEAEEKAKRLFDEAMRRGDKHFEEAIRRDEEELKRNKKKKN